MINRATVVPTMAAVYDDSCDKRFMTQRRRGIRWCLVGEKMEDNNALWNRLLTGKVRLILIM